ncbi:MAG TPA: hypothetical protein VH306_06695 [Gaiellaceae bacterium]|jgi:hypothetical protein
MVYRILNALNGLVTSQECRRCTQPILAEDRYGLSEGVCTACRS